MYGCFSVGLFVLRSVSALWCPSGLYSWVCFIFPLDVLVQIPYCSMFHCHAEDIYSRFIHSPEQHNLMFTNWLYSMNKSQFITVQVQNKHTISVLGSAGQTPFCLHMKKWQFLIADQEGSQHINSGHGYRYKPEDSSCYANIFRSKNSIISLYWGSENYRLLSRTFSRYGKSFLIVFTGNDGMLTEVWPAYQFINI